MSEFINPFYKNASEHFYNLTRKQYSEQILRPDQIQQIIKDAQTKKLGEGTTKIAYKSKMKVDDSDYEVALLAIKNGGSIPNVMRELFIMSLIHHPLTIKSFGWYPDPSRSVPLAGNYYSFFIVEELGIMTLEAYSTNNLYQENFVYPFLLILYGIAKVIAYIHSIQIVNRDIKPQNIFLIECPFASNGPLTFFLPKISDFDTSNKIAKTNRTYTGTEKYMDPNISSLKFIEHADVYSFGCIICNILQLGNNATKEEKDIIEFLLQLGNKCKEDQKTRPFSPDVVSELEHFCESKLIEQNTKYSEQFVSVYQQFKKYLNQNAPPDSNHALVFQATELIPKISYEKNYDELFAAISTEGRIINAFIHEFGIGIDQDIFEALFLYYDIWINSPDRNSNIFDHILRVANSLGLFYDINEEDQNKTVTTILKESLKELRSRANAGEFVAVGRYAIYLKSCKKAECEAYFKKYFELYESSEGKYIRNPHVCLQYAMILSDKKDYETALNVIKDFHTDEIERFKVYLTYNSYANKKK